MAHTFSVCHNCQGLNKIGIKEAKKKAPVCGRCKETLPMDGLVVSTDFTGLRKLREKTGMPIVVDFWASWCEPCKVFAPIFKASATELRGRAVFCKLDTEANPAVNQAYAIRSIPTIVLFDENGNELERQSGMMSKDPFLTWLRSKIEA